MKIVGIDNREYIWHLASFPKENASELHLEARRILREIFPLDNILEEVYLPGSGGLYCDFYLPHRRLMVEVHGEQHYKFNNFFFKDKIQFWKSNKRDNDKMTWCELNKIDYLALPFNRIDEWKTLVFNRE